jgi:hypothetical protein
MLIHFANQSLYRSAILCLVVASITHLGGLSGVFCRIACLVIHRWHCHLLPCGVMSYYCFFGNEAKKTPRQNYNIMQCPVLLAWLTWTLSGQKAYISNMFFSIRNYLCVNLWAVIGVVPIRWIQYCPLQRKTFRRAKCACPQTGQCRKRRIAPSRPRPIHAAVVAVLLVY